MIKGMEIATETAKLYKSTLDRIRRMILSTVRRKGERKATVASIVDRFIPKGEKGGKK